MRFSRGLVWAVTTCLLSGAVAIAQGDQSSATLSCDGDCAAVDSHPGGGAG